MIHKEFNHGDTEDTEVRTYVTNPVILRFAVCDFLIKKQLDIGAQIGPHLLQHVSDQNFKRIFSVLLVITAVWLFANSFASSKG